MPSRSTESLAVAVILEPIRLEPKGYGCNLFPAPLPSLFVFFWMGREGPPWGPFHRIISTPPFFFFGGGGGEGAIGEFT